MENRSAWAAIFSFCLYYILGFSLQPLCHKKRHKKDIFNHPSNQKRQIEVLRDKMGMGVAPLLNFSETSIKDDNQWKFQTLACHEMSKSTATHHWKLWRNIFSSSIYFLLLSCSLRNSTMLKRRNVEVLRQNFIVQELSSLIWTILPREIRNVKSSNLFQKKRREWTPAPNSYEC